MVAVKSWLPVTSGLATLALASVLNAGVTTVDNLVSLLRTNNPYFASYQQIIKDVNGVIIEESQGQVGIRGEELRWITNQPFEQVIIVSDGKISIYDPDIAQVIHRKIEESFYINPMGLLVAKNTDILSKFNVRTIDADVGLSFSLTPIGADPIMPAFIISFENDFLKEINISGEFGQLIGIKFYQSSTDIEGDVFGLNLKALENVDVIGER